MPEQSAATGGKRGLLKLVPKPRPIRVAGAISLDAQWPVGSVFVGNVSTNPNTLLGFGTWTAVQSGIWISIGSVNMYIWQRTA
jgi:hypothetical protein